MVESIHIRRSLVRFPGAKAMAQADGMAMSSAIRVEPTEMITELKKWRK